MSRSIFGFVLCLLLVFLGGNARGANENAISVAVDQRVELMSIIFRLAGNPEYNQGRLTSYLNDIEAHFGPHREHAAIQTARKLRQSRGVSFDAVMSMAIHLTDAVELQERVPFDAPESKLDSRWKPREAREFLKHMREFVNDAKVQEFFDRHRELYEPTSRRMNHMLIEHADLVWFDSFFGARPVARFVLVPALVNGGQAYGPSIRLADGTEELYAIIGVWNFDETGLPQFDKRVLPTVIHEFCHSFVNHLVKHKQEEFRDAGKLLYATVADQMKRQAYGDWITMMQESVVRAAVVRYLIAHDGPAAVEQIEEEKRRGFVWMPQLVTLIDEFEADRTAFPTFEAFMPRIVKFFDESAPAMAAEIKKSKDELEAKRPKIVSMTPKVGSDNVDPTTKFIMITFDRPMDVSGYSLIYGPEGEATLPKIGQALYDADGTVFSIKVELEPNRRYEFLLNGERGGKFKSADGTPLKQTVVRFSTGSAR